MPAGGFFVRCKRRNIGYRGVMPIRNHCWPAAFRALALVALSLFAAMPTHAAFHFWHVKEVFSNADGSVQFIELFDSFNNENFVSGHTLRSNSDGVIKNFTLLSNAPSSLTANKHLLFATPGFSALPGGVTPNYTLPDPGVSGPFFNPNATSITITFLASGDSMTFSGASLPKNGYQSLTDTARRCSTRNANYRRRTNTPTNFAGTSGSVNLITPNGDYNNNGKVDAADYSSCAKRSLNRSHQPEPAPTETRTARSKLATTISGEPASATT